MHTMQKSEEEQEFFVQEGLLIFGEGIGWCGFISLCLLSLAVPELFLVALIVIFYIFAMKRKLRDHRYYVMDYYERKKRSKKYVNNMSCHM